MMVAVVSGFVVQHSPMSREGIRDWREPWGCPVADSRHPLVMKPRFTRVGVHYPSTVTPETRRDLLGWAVILTP